MEAEHTNEDTQSRNARLPVEYLYFTVDDVAEMLCVAPSTVRTLLRKERWPHSKFGVQVRFTLADLDAIRTMHRVDVALKARPTHIGSDQARRRAHAYNIRNGLVEQRYSRPIP
ncbi:helix-turn-helix domain-containing protein [Pseudarthrobacter sp. CCNWLW207]|uniref:helix-turn-helix domain-containing protein n=1 Tax=Pseudarthrobacter sp. CCNWLW207 TaxID=3127468 RepID=UPI003078A1EC